MSKANPGVLDGCRGEESDLVRLERLHGANSNLSDPVLRTSSNLSTVMQHWKPMPQEVVHSHFIGFFLGVSRGEIFITQSNAGHLVTLTHSFQLIHQPNNHLSESVLEQKSTLRFCKATLALPLNR